MKQQAFIIACGLALFFIACGNDLKDVQMVNAGKETPDESMTQVTIVYTDDGKERAVLVAPLIHKYGNMAGRTEFPKGLVVNFYTKEGKNESFLKSGFAVLNDKTRQFVLEKNVQMINFNRQDTLDTQYLVWKQDSAIITTDKKVYLHGPKEKITGHHFRAKENFTKYTLKRVKVDYFYNQNDTLK